MKDALPASASSPLKRVFPYRLGQPTILAKGKLETEYFAHHAQNIGHGTLITIFTSRA